MTSNKSILITGCSTGIGYTTALYLKKKNYQVIATCRKEKDMQRLLELGLDVVLMDLNHRESIHQGFEQVLKITQGKLDVLINNAGYGQVGALEDVTHEEFVAQFTTNVIGLMDLTRLAIPVLRASQGRIINLSSILGLISLPFRGAYNASKHAVEGLSDSLRLELKSSGIQVITIVPGPIESEFRNTSVDLFNHKHLKNSYFDKQYQQIQKSFKLRKSDSIFTLAPDAVTQKVVKAIEAKSPKPKYYVTFPAYLLNFLKRVLPIRWMDCLLLMISKQELK